MKYLNTIQKSKEIDSNLINDYGLSSITLMENASRGVFDELAKVFPSLENIKILIICGKGNNGGDGFALARHCIIANMNVDCIMLHDEWDLTKESLYQFTILKNLYSDKINFHNKKINDQDYEIIIDAILGIGAIGNLNELYSDIITWANNKNCFRISIDVPTGLNADTGLIFNEICFKADLTITMGSYKPGLFFNLGRIYCGKVKVVHIGVSDYFFKSNLVLLDKEIASNGIEKFSPTQHKYQRGKTVIIGGSIGMSGAALIASEASLESGAGIVYLITPFGCNTNHRNEIISFNLKANLKGTFEDQPFSSYSDLLDSAKSLVVGCGLGKSETLKNFISDLLINSKVPIVLDADGLNAFNENPDEISKHKSELIITPHHSEMSRLLKIPTEEIAMNPIEIAKISSKRFHCITVLKGAPTVVADTNGFVYINSVGNSSMATAGSGDALAGVIGSLVAQNSGNAFNSVLTSVFAHSFSGDLSLNFKGTKSVTTSDIIANLYKAFIYISE